MDGIEGIGRWEMRMELRRWRDIFSVVSRKEERGGSDSERHSTQESN